MIMFHPFQLAIYHKIQNDFLFSTSFQEKTYKNFWYTDKGIDKKKKTYQMKKKKHIV